MPDEPGELIEAVAHAEDAFAGQLGRPDYEEGLDPNAHGADVIQLRKACRLQAKRVECLGVIRENKPLS